MTFSKGEFKQTKCNLDGAIEVGTGQHFYIILTKKEYNTQTGHVLAVPFTSKITLHSLNYGMTLTNESIDGDFKLRYDPSYILFDRICRLKINKHFKKNDNHQYIPSNYNKIKDHKLKEIKSKVASFILRGQRNITVDI